MGGVVEAAAPSAARWIAGNLAGQVGADVAGGMASGALNTNHSDLKGVLGDTAFGGATGGILGGATRAFGAVVSPQLSANGQTLVDAGVRNLTPGQAALAANLPGGGMVKALEDRLTSFPLFFTGDAVKSGQRTAINEFNRGGWNQSLAHIGDELPAGVPSGHAAVQYTKDAFNNAYGKVLPQVAVQLDGDFGSDMSSIATSLRNVSPELQNDYLRHVQYLLGPKVTNGINLSGDNFKDAYSDLRDIGFDKLGDSSSGERAVGSALVQTSQALRGIVGRQQPALGDVLDRTDAGYGLFKRLQKASAAPGSEAGVFSPAQLRSAVSQSDKSLDKGKFAAGAVPLQQYAEAGQAILPSKIPDSGTAARLDQTAILGGGGLGGLLGPTGLGAAIPHLIYGPPGRAITNLWLKPRPAPVQDFGKLLSGSTVPGLFGGAAPAITAPLMPQQAYYPQQDAGTSPLPPGR